jgi:hypothetical protein
MGEAQKMENPTLENIISLGANTTNAKGMLSALGHYGFVDIGRYNSVLADALKSLLAEYEVENQTHSESTPSVVEDNTQSDEAEDEGANQEDLFLEIIEKLDLDVKGAAWEDIVSEAEKKGLSKMQIEETTNSLLDKGLIYEPVLGRIKKI